MIYFTGDAGNPKLNVEKVSGDLKMNKLIWFLVGVIVGIILCKIAFDILMDFVML